MVDDATARAWLAGQGFAEGDLRSEITINNKKRCPMAWASQKGELGVCKWLHENGAAADHQGEQRRRHSHVRRLL